VLFGRPQSSCHRQKVSRAHRVFPTHISGSSCNFRFVFSRSCFRFGFSKQGVNLDFPCRNWRPALPCVVLFVCSRVVRVLWFGLCDFVWVWSFAGWIPGVLLSHRIESLEDLWSKSFSRGSFPNTPIKFSVKCLRGDKLFFESILPRLRTRRILPGLKTGPILLVRFVRFYQGWELVRFYQGWKLVRIDLSVFLRAEGMPNFEVWDIGQVTVSNFDWLSFILLWSPSPVLEGCPEVGINDVSASVDITHSFFIRVCRTCFSTIGRKMIHLLAC
jgi:hypothetical protein